LGDQIRSAVVVAVHRDTTAPSAREHDSGFARRRGHEPASAIASEQDAHDLGRLRHRKLSEGVKIEYLIMLGHRCFYANRGVNCCFHTDTNGRAEQLFRPKGEKDSRKRMQRTHNTDVILRLWNLQIAANLSCRELIDLSMARQAGRLSVAGIPPDRMIAGLA